LVFAVCSDSGSQSNARSANASVVGTMSETQASLTLYSWFVDQLWSLDFSLSKSAFWSKRQERFECSKTCCWSRGFTDHERMFRFGDSTGWYSSLIKHLLSGFWSVCTNCNGNTLFRSKVVLPTKSSRNTFKPSSARLHGWLMKTRLWGRHEFVLPTHSTIYCFIGTAKLISIQKIWQTTKL